MIDTQNEFVLRSMFFFQVAVGAADETPPRTAIRAMSCLKKANDAAVDGDPGTGEPDENE